MQLTTVANHDNSYTNTFLQGLHSGHAFFSKRLDHTMEIHPNYVTVYINNLISSFLHKCENNIWQRFE